jgi:hypothetical protein
MATVSPRNWRWLFRPWTAGQAEAAALQHDLQCELAGQRPMPTTFKAATAKAHALKQLYISYRMQSLLAAPSRYAELKAMRFSWKERQAGKAAWRKHRTDLRYRAETIRCKEAAAANLRTPAAVNRRPASYTLPQRDSSLGLLPKQVPAAVRWQRELVNLAPQPGITAYGSHSFTAFGFADRGKGRHSNLGTSFSTQGLQASLRSASASAATAGAGGAWAGLVAEPEPPTRSQASSVTNSQGSFSSFSTASTSTSVQPVDDKLLALPEEGQCTSLPCADHDHPPAQLTIPDSIGVHCDQPDVLQLGVSSCAAQAPSSRHITVGSANASDRSGYAKIRKPLTT